MRGRQTESLAPLITLHNAGGSHGTQPFTYVSFVQLRRPGDLLTGGRPKISHRFKQASAMPHGNHKGRGGEPQGYIRSPSVHRASENGDNRHEMSQTVRDKVTPESHEWGYQLSSVHLRQVHFRDREMIRQDGNKVVNRLRQVTAAGRSIGPRRPLAAQPRDSAALPGPGALPPSGRGVS